MSKKNYLKYSEKEWKRYFENKVQYINRIQSTEWLKMFENVGFELVEKILNFCDIDRIKIDKKYRIFEENDLACLDMIVIHKKPFVESRK